MNIFRKFLSSIYELVTVDNSNEEDSNIETIEFHESAVDGILFRVACIAVMFILVVQTFR